MTTQEITSKAIQFAEATIKQQPHVTGYDRATMDAVIAEGLRGDERDVMVGSTMRMHVLFTNLVCGEVLRDGKWLPQTIPADKMDLAVGNTLAAKAANASLIRSASGFEMLAR